MPTVEKVTGGRVHVRDIGHFEAGGRAEVSEADARYLVEERGDFETVDDDTDAETDSDAETCQVVKTDGEVCGRELPCPYHSDEEA
jgi:hypothetical protein